MSMGKPFDLSECVTVAHYFETHNWLTGQPGLFPPPWWREDFFPFGPNWADSITTPFRHLKWRLIRHTQIPWLIMEAVKRPIINSLALTMEYTCVYLFAGRVTQIYEQFAEPLCQWECKLAILHCAYHYDAALVTNIRQNVINVEVKKLGQCRHWAEIGHSGRQDENAGSDVRSIWAVFYYRLNSEGQNSASSFYFKYGGILILP